MAKEYKTTIPAHPSIYQPGPRELNLYFCEPDQGINSDTGILLMIPGFGATAESKVYKKMRHNFADNYNLVTVQCDYFGYEFMQEDKHVNFQITYNQLKKIFSPSDLKQIVDEKQGIDISKLIEFGSQYNLNISGKEILAENPANFNDMGIMQALDNITAVLVTALFIQDNDYILNSGRIFAYGHSHGAYLCHLCNAFAPNLFSLIIDNSAWLFPVYLNKPRYVGYQAGKLIYSVAFDYLANRLPYDQEILFLPSLYKKFHNKTTIITFQGTTDNLINHNGKKNFCESINASIYNEISNDKIDGKVFKSTNHGLDADFLKLFDYVMDNQLVSNKKTTVIDIPSVEFETSKYRYLFNYSSGVPIMDRKTK